MYVRRLDEIEDLRFDVTHLPGPQKPTDPLSRRGFADGVDGRPGPRESAGALLAPRPRRANTGVAWIHPRRVGQHSTLRRGRLRRRQAAREGGHANPTTPLQGGRYPSRLYWYVGRSRRLGRRLSTGFTPAPRPPARRDDRGGAHHRAADDGGRVRHDPEHLELLKAMVEPSPRAR